MFWICKNCFSLYDVNVGKCRECGGTELIQKETEEKVEFVTAAPPPVPGTSPQVPETPLAETEAEEDPEASSIYPVGKDAVKALQRALEFIKNQQKMDFQQRCREYEPQYQKHFTRYEKELEEYQKALMQYSEFKNQADNQGCCIALIAILVWFGYFIWCFWGLRKPDFHDFCYLLFTTGGIAGIGILIGVCWSVNRLKSKKIPYPPQAPEEQPPYPDTDADFERYFERCPDPPTGKEYFRPTALARLIGILENRLAETIPEAMRFMVAEDRANREHQEEMRVMNEMNRHAQEAASSASSAASAARNASTMATLGTALQAIDMMNRRK